MGELRAVPDLLARSDRSFARTQHRLRTIKVWILGPFGCLYVGSLVYWTVAFVAVWHDGDWLFYWAGLMGVAPIGIGFARFALWRDSRADLFAPVAQLRQAIRDGDETLAPVAETPREPTSDVSSDPSRLGPLRRPAATGTIATLWVIAALVLLVPCVGVPLALGAGNGSLALLFAAAGLLPGLVCALLGWCLLSPLFVRSDHDGLRWRRPIGLVAFVAWRDAKGLFSLTYASPFANDRETLYVLDGSTATLVWRAGADTESVASLRSPALMLCQLITEYAGLPLRDVTAQAKRIALGSEGTVPHTSPGARTLVGASHLPGEEIRHRFRMLGVALSPFLTLALVSLGAMVGQAPYFEHLYVQAHSHVALYRDALTHADGDWPDNAFSHFEKGVYHVQQTENWTYPTDVVAPHRYDHALVEVSGRTGGTFDLGGVGLVIAGPSSSTPLLTFSVAPEGSWWIARLSPYYETNNSTRLGDMSAIHKGLGVWNRIAVLMNGSDFTFYVNGHFATGYHDDALQGGEVGLYLDSPIDSGDFSNFAVYPL
jgi:hypothetical protein